MSSKKCFFSRAIRYSKTLFLALLSLLLISQVAISDSSWSTYDPENPLNRFKFNQSPGIDIYLSPTLLRFFGDNFDTVLERNGYSPTSFYIHEHEKRTGKKPLEEIITNQDILNSIKEIRSNFRSFFRGITIKNNHDLELKTTGIDLSANWSKFGVRVVGYQGNPNKIMALFVFEADRLALNISSMKIKDHQHHFIGEVGGDKLYIKLNETDSPPLQIYVPIEIEYGHQDNEISVKVNRIESNISSINLKAGWSAPLSLPKVRVTVNNRSSYLRADKVERTLKKEIPNLLSGIQEKLEEYLLIETPQLLEETILKSTSKGYKDLIGLPIMFSPENEANADTSNEISNNFYPDQALLGMKLSQIGMRDGHVRLRLDAFVEDGKNQNGTYVGFSKRANVEVASKFLKSRDYHVLTSVNIGLINHYIQVSCRRGYFKKLNLGGEEIRITGCPYVIAKERSNELRLVVNLLEDVGGSWYNISSYAVNSPIGIQFEVGLKFELNNKGNYSLKLTRIYSNTVYIAPHHINFGTDSVYESARERLNEVNNDIQGDVVVDEIPLPTEIMGIPLKHLRSRIDKNGHVIFYLKTIL